MEKYKTIQEDIQHVTNNEVEKKTKISTVAIVLIIVAVLAAVGGMSYTDPNSSMPSFLFALSVCFFLTGIINLFVNRSAYFFKPTNSRLKSVTAYFDIHESGALQTSLEMKRFDEFKRLKRLNDSGVKVEALVAADQKFVAVQVSEYIPYTFEAVTPVMCYYGKEAQEFSSCFLNR